MLFGKNIVDAGRRSQAKPQPSWDATDKRWLLYEDKVIMWEGVIAVALVAVAVVWVGWSIYRSATGKGGCGGPCSPRCPEEQLTIRCGVPGLGEDESGKKAEAGDAAASSIQADAARRSRSRPGMLQISVDCSIRQCPRQEDEADDQA